MGGHERWGRDTRDHMRWKRNEMRDTTSEGYIRYARKERYEKENRASGETMVEKGYDGRYNKDERRGTLD